MISSAQSTWAKTLAAGLVATGLVACSSSDNNNPQVTDPNHSASSSSSSSSSGSSTSSGGMTTACTDALVCAKFDDSATIPQGWSAGSDRVTVSSEQAFSGMNSLKVQSTSTGGYESNYLIYDLSGTPELSDKMYGRMMIRLSDQNANAEDFTFIQANGPVQSGEPEAAGATAMYRARVDGSDDHIFANYDTWNPAESWSTDCWKQPATPTPSEYIIPKNEWACVQWHFERDTNSLSYWLNGVELSQINVMGTGDGCNGDAEAGVWTAPASFEDIRVGIEQYAPDAAGRTLYIDDIAIDDQMVSCYGNPVPSNPGPDVENGLALYQSAEQNCQGCHGDGAAFSGWVSKYPDQESLATVIHDTMPLGESTLCEANCSADIAAYILSTQE